MFSQVEALALGSDGTLYAGGWFRQAGFVSADYVAAWNSDVGWSALGSGLPAVTYSLVVDNNDTLYAGTARFGGTVYSWSGSAWSEAGGFSHTVTELALDSQGRLYAGTTVGEIASWDGSGWSRLGSGLNSVPHSLGVDSTNNLWVGGEFTIAGDKTSVKIAKWTKNFSELSNSAPIILSLIHI